MRAQTNLEYRSKTVGGWYKLVHVKTEADDDDGDDGGGESERELRR